MADSIEVAKSIEQIIRNDCPPMVFPLRVDTLAKIAGAVGAYAESRYNQGRVDEALEWL
jgi:hypothetical protein